MLFKHEIPVLEYDTDPTAAIMPNRHAKYTIPSRCVFGFLGDEIDRYAEDNDLETVAVLESVTKTFPVYKTKYDGVDVALCQAPCGAAPATQLLDFLIGCGATDIIAVGGCGVLQDIAENEILIPTHALRDEGTSYKYLPPAREIECDPRAIVAIEKALEKHDIPFEHVKTWTTDGFFRETKDMVRYRLEEGYTVVEMECAALAACAAFRDVLFGQILFTCDSLADLDSHDDRTWGADSFGTSLHLALAAVLIL